MKFPRPKLSFQLLTGQTFMDQVLEGRRPRSRWWRQEPVKHKTAVFLKYFIQKRQKADLQNFKPSVSVGVTEPPPGPTSPTEQKGGGSLLGFPRLPRLTLRRQADPNTNTENNIYS